MAEETFRFPIRVYFEDTDAGGVVYHASYVRFLERARTEWLRAHGVVQRELARERGILFAIVSMNLDFLRPAHLDDALEASCALERAGGASLQFSQRLVRPADDALLVQASVRAASLHADTFRPCALPADLHERLAANAVRTPARERR